MIICNKNIYVSGSLFVLNRFCEYLNKRKYFSLHFVFIILIIRALLNINISFDLYILMINKTFRRMCINLYKYFGFKIDTTEMKICVWKKKYFSNDYASSYTLKVIKLWYFLNKKSCCSILKFPS